jgi:hypothetical protein
VVVIHAIMRCSATRQHGDLAMVRRAGKGTLRAKAATRGGTWSLWVAGVGFIAVIIFGIWLMTPRAQGTADLRAGLIDQLSPVYPNVEFQSSVIADIESCGLPLDAYEGDQVDVDLYRTIGEDDFGVLVIRSHSGTLELPGSEDESVVALFTNEPYSESTHRAEQLLDRVLIVRPFEGDQELTFGVTPDFFRHSMRGRLPGTIVVIAGCSILNKTNMADALVSRGASVVVSFDRSVGLAHADGATALVVHHLLDEGMTVEDSVVAAMAEAGPDPEFGAVLKFYPASAGGLTAKRLLGQ